MHQVEEKLACFATNQQNVKNQPACLVTWLCFVRIVVETQLSLAGN